MKKFFITTSIAYVNAPPHIGFALESVQADVLARWQKVSGREIFFQTGTDEHGAKIARAAEKSGLTAEEFVCGNAELFKSLKDALCLSWDAFVRTTDKKTHWPRVEEMWKKLEAAGDLYKKNYRGFYCVGHEAFVTEKDLVDGVCRDHREKPQVIEEENWFFRLSKYAKQIELGIKNNELRIVPKTRTNEILSLFKEGIEDISFSRPSKDLKWGIPVPGDPTQTIYVWADALTNYLDYPEHWPADVHLIGKDILRFHALIWPGMLLSAKLPLPGSVFVHGHITVKGGKMSKTLGNVVDPFELTKKYGTDPVRYYLLREIPSTEDGDFSYEKFEERYNGDLANGLGNFSARVLTLAGNVGKLENGDKNPEQEVGETIEAARKEVAQKVERFRLHEALSAIWMLISYGDNYVNSRKVWALSGEEKTKALFNLVTILNDVALLLAPFLPETSRKISDCIIREEDGFSVKKGTQLFPRIK